MEPCAHVKSARNEEKRQDNKMANIEAIQIRREQVYNMSQMGIGSTAIAKQLGICDRQVRKDLEIVRKQNAGQLKKIDFLQRISDYSYRHNERVKRLWGIISDKSSNKKQIISALADLRKEDELSIKCDQIVGILPKEVSPLTIETNTDGEGISNIQVNIIQQSELKTKEKTEVHEIHEQKPQIVNKMHKK